MNKNFILLCIVFISGILIGAMLFSGKSQDQEGEEHIVNGESNISPTWICSMHPEVKKNGPGKCPICGMDLVVQKEGGAKSSQELKLSAHAMKLAEIESVPVYRDRVFRSIRVVGKLGFDETLQKTITARVPGRLDRLFVDYTGVRVNKKDHLVSIYSPELLAAQEELIQTQQAMQGSEQRHSLKRTFKAIQEKLRLWGLDKDQIAKVLASKKASDHMTIRSPMQGVVIHKMINEGMYVKAGSPLYMIVDLTKLWLKLDVYETELPWIHYGQEVEFETQAWPGEIFKGKIIFIDPVVDSKTRTIKVRVQVPNPNEKLKPEMFARATIRASFQNLGGVMPEELKGKWISPMHPEIVKDEPGDCDICGMSLVKTESLFKPGKKKQSKPLVIPASAVLMTGKRALVYIDKGEGEFTARNIGLGAKVDDRYIVKSGLKEGERVVIRGSFKIDSAVQLNGGTSMMNPGLHDPVHRAKVLDSQHDEGSHRHEEQRENESKHKGSHHHGSHKQKEVERKEKGEGSHHHGSHKQKEIKKKEKDEGSHHHGSHKH